MNNNINILYRGPLESCNYDCEYCPFAKKKNSREELQYDKKCLDKFVDWMSEQIYNIGVLFTPWGEALIRNYYQEAITKISHLDNVNKVAIQTNLSGSLKWLEKANKKTTALWTTYHPTEISVDNFLDKCRELKILGINFSVGVVGKKENFIFAQQLRESLPNSIYVWVNAFKREPNYYTEEEVIFLNEIDPHFNLNNTVYKTLGKACFAGESSISIDGEGNVNRCHFIKNKIGNIYEQSLAEMLKPSTCSNAHCRCYIGYMNLKELNLENIYSDKILERIPKGILTK